MLKQIVHVVVDRPLHSVHPEHPDIIYSLNYGYVPKVFSKVDYEEMDAYILDVEEPILEYTGEVIAILHRFEEEDKLIVSNVRYSKEEITSKTNFIEQYFSSYIEMAYPSKEDILFDLRNSGLKSSDTVFIHSSLKSFGAIDGKEVLSAFKTFFKEGMVIFPTHTWSAIREDGDTFFVEKTKSCVGTLTNLALVDPDFKRSMHPTHSVCAFGKNKEEYVRLDLNQTTPVSPTGCTGSLWKYKAKLLFAGVPQSKNTFIHSIEEELQVPDRFTEKIYHFKSKFSTLEIEYFMPKHFSTKRDHLSENYAKLKPHFLNYNIAKEVYIGNSITTIVDAEACREYVKHLLIKNIHLFDDDKEFVDDEGYKKTKK